jgi:hypothetical protein
VDELRRNLSITPDVFMLLAVAAKTGRFSVDRVALRALVIDALNASYR